MIFRKDDKVYILLCPQTREDCLSGQGLGENSAYCARCFKYHLLGECEKQPITEAEAQDFEARLG
ncbi:MAG: hypothetical protein JWN37_296 [Candidatus Nomurabacteria bacterium]|nr:hypothetical protein [Candidatus Nomurabacteria bacterium]